MKNITALIGIGYWGKIHFKYLINQKNVFLKYIFYRTNLPNDIPAEYKKICVNNLDLILNDKSIKFIHIVTPIDSHQYLTNFFLKGNKNILVEKPLIINKYYEKKFHNYLNYLNSNLVVSYPYLFSDTLKYAKNLINKNLIGSLKHIKININQCGRFMNYDVNKLLAPHAISILSIFTNIREINFEVFNLIKKSNKIETVLILCSKKNKNIATINLSLNYASFKTQKNIEIFTDNATIHCNLSKNEENLKLYQYKKIRKNNYYVGQTKLKISKNFDEQNNMRRVIESFHNGKRKNKSNYDLTLKINEYIKNSNKG